MAASTSTVSANAIPRRGDRLPSLTGRSPDGETRSTRDFYMRRNLAVLIVPADTAGQEWIEGARAVREAAHAEDGEIVVIAPPGVAAGDLPSIIDEQGELAAKLSVADQLPALFITDRYGTVFATNRGPDAIPDLAPRDIPGWLEFVACRCT